MNGNDVKDLNVYLGSAKVFSKSGSQGNAWKKAEVSISGQGNVSHLQLFTPYWLFTSLNIIDSQKSRLSLPLRDFLSVTVMKYLY